MHLKRLSRVVAVTVVLTMVTPSAVLASDMTKVGTNTIETPEDVDSASIKAVSYTHLDVYKRQGKNRGKMNHI